MKLSGFRGSFEIDLFSDLDLSENCIILEHRKKQEMQVHSSVAGGVNKVDFNVLIESHWER